MRRGYIRLSKAGPSLEVQQAALRSAGIDDFSQYGPVYVDEIPVRRSAKPLPQRFEAIRSLEPGDELVVASAARLGTTAGDVLAVFQEIGQKGAVVFDAETGKTVQWHPDAIQAIEYAQRAESANRKEISAKMRRRRVETDRLGGPSVKGWKVPVKRAKELWDDDKLSAAYVAEQVGVSVPTLYRRLGDRGIGMGGDTRSKKVKKDSTEGPKG